MLAQTLKARNGNQFKPELNRSPANIDLHENGPTTFYSTTNIIATPKMATDEVE